MKNDLIKAIDTLNNGQYTCVLCKDNEIHTSTERGVKPLLAWLDAEIDLKGFSAADKVVGKAAAFLYVLLGVKEVYAPIMSESAIYTLARNGIQPHCDKSVKHIINRAGTGFCPLEEAVGELTDPKEALNKIKLRLIELSNAML
ncbi:DUF1893 domain-containing protein [Enterocloster bolteae]|uniref:DUF1893 domain-containing protein n=1 Tax=Enterocloster bolteae TaxID=208479 RepID=UPI0028DCA551|nr:DUF1893 domain-containing protein [Enterocloster bolteae]